MSGMFNPARSRVKAELEAVEAGQLVITGMAGGRGRPLSPDRISRRDRQAIVTVYLYGGHLEPTSRRGSLIQ
jgi:hypothetical protein